MLSHLLEDNDEGVDKVLEIPWSLLDFIKVVIKTGCHDARVSIAKCSLHVLIELVYRLHLVKTDENHHSFFPDHLLGVLHQGKHYILDGRYNVGMRQFGDDVESCHDLKMILRLEVLLHRSDNQDQNIARLVNE